MSKQEKVDEFIGIESLILQYGEELAKLAYTYVKDSHQAEDIVQDVFLKAYEKRDFFRYEASYKTYLYRLTINKCYDYFRSWTYKNIILNDFFSRTTNLNFTPEDEFIKEESNYLLGQRILSLPVKNREVIVLHYYKDLSIDEISHILNCSKNTVKTRLVRGRNKLKKKLKSEGGDFFEG